MYYLKLDSKIHGAFTEFSSLRQWVYKHGGKDLGEDTWTMPDGRVAHVIEEIDF
jgi:hypothetical protein